MIYAMERSDNRAGGIRPCFIRASGSRGLRCGSTWRCPSSFCSSFRGWGKLAAVISVATIITYLVGPISVMVLRRTAPNLHRPLRVPGLPLLAPIAFVLATLMLFLGALAAYRPDHAAADSADACVSLLPSQVRTGSISAANCAVPGGC